jgi:outer membrane protein assembly factor BamB
MRWRLIAIVAGVLLFAGGTAGAWYYHDQTETKNVRGSSTEEFDTAAEPVGGTAPTVPATTAATTTGPPERTLADWPLYGYEPGRTRVATFKDLRPPFTTLWERDTSLIEFPPIAANGKVYVAEARGHFYGADGKTGKIVWQHQFKRCSAGSPAYADGVVYHAYMGPRCKRVAGAKGLVVAMDSETGAIKWRSNTEVIESSLLYVKGVLYFGGWDGKIVSLDAKTGKQRWSFSADSGITSSVAYNGGTLFVGSDGGSFYAIDASSGKLRWKSGSYSKFGKREYFYATPAVAYGRVYAPNTDGYVYSFGEKSGKLRWARRVGTYVYSAPAIWKKTVYVGTYDGFLVAMDAATGEEKWKYSAPAAVHGAATVVDGVVYFSTLKGKHSGSARRVKDGPGRTFGLDATSGKVIWRRDEGRYTPIIADGQRVYFTGFGHLYGLEPKE